MHEPVAHVLSPHTSVPPHPSGAWPQFHPCAAHVVGVQQEPVDALHSWPVGQDEVVQTHWPALHWGVLPEQELHEPPAVPQYVGLCDSHVVPLQHPFGQEEELHTHWPVLELHVCPAGHEVEVHTHVPVELHDGLVGSLHDAHDAPPLPQEVGLSLPSCTQLWPLQQPGHVEPPQLHTPLLHASPAPHDAHVAPLVPQEPGP